MPSINLPHFGNIDSESVEEYYCIKVEYNNTRVQIDINFEKDSIDSDRLDNASRFIDNIRIHDLNNKKHIQKDFDDEDGDTVMLYIEHHLAELATDDLNMLIGTGTKTADKPGGLLSKLHLIRVGLYPESREQFATFDYSIGKELTDYMVVISTDESGNVDNLAMES